MDAGAVCAAAGRWLTFVGLTVGIGAVAFRYGTLGRAGDAVGVASRVQLERRAATLGAWAAMLLVLGALVRLWAQFVALSDPTQSASEGRALLGSIVLRTQFGRVWIASVVLALGLWAAFGAVRRGRGAGWPAALLSAGALALTPALAGHATGESAYRAVTIGADAIHVLAAGAWLGTLLVLALTAIVPVVGSAEPVARLAALVRAFSPVALVSATTLAATGVYASWIHLGSLGAIVGSEYGRMLVIKLAFVALMAASGAYNWLRATPRLAAGDARALRHSARAELVLGALVLLATAILVATPLPGEH